MSSSKNMFITPRGLNTISRELINKRKFQPYLITKVGLPVVLENGVTNSLDNNNYFKHEGLEFLDTDKVSIKFKGTYLFPENKVDGETLWSFTSSTLEPVSLIMFPNKISLMLGRKNLGDLVLEEFENNTSIDIKVTLSKLEYTVTYVYNSKYNIVSGKLADRITPSEYKNINIGVSPIFKQWLGDVDLNDFIIFKNKEVYYAPSTEPAFHFTKVMISNGNIPLTDKSTPLINNVYEFEISEITRTGGNLLLLTRIDSDVYLNIAEVGLYSVTDEGPMLFAKVSGLSIRKNKDLGYGLLFNIRLDLGVVNTVAMPEIVVHTKDVANQKDFQTIKRVHTYISIDMERIINMNALKLGYGRAHKVSDNYNKFKSWMKNNENVQNYLRLNNRVRTKEERYFNRDKIQVIGDLSITDKGETSNFTNANYAYVGDINSDEKSWKFSTSFQSEEENSPQTILNMYGRTAVDPLLLGIDKENNCFIKAGKRERINVLNESLATSIKYFRNCYNDAGIGTPEEFYAWENLEGSMYANSHVISKGDLSDKNGILNGFSADNYATAPTEWNLNGSFSFDINFTKKEDSVAEEVIIAANKDHVFQISWSNENRLIYRIGNGTSWVNEDSIYGSHFLNPGTEYSVKITFDGETYKGILGLEDKTTYEQDWSLKSNTLLQKFTLIIGQDYKHEKVWNGFINLLNSSLLIKEKIVWTGGTISNKVLTKEKEPTSSSTLYDIEQYPFKGTSITSAFKGELFNRALFKVKPFKKYNILVEHSKNEYKVFVGSNGNNMTLIYYLENEYSINPISTVFFGIENDKSNFLEGVMYLEETDLITGDKDYSPVNKIIKEREMKDFYYLTDYPYSLYKAANLKDPDKTELEVFEGGITGREDNINFNNPKGFSLSIKVYLKDGADKVILAKVNPQDNSKYFVLQYMNDTLSFKLFGESEMIELKKDYVVTTFRQLTDYPTTLTITYNGDPFNAVFNMYKNNTLLDSYKGPLIKLLHAKDFVLTNYLDFAQPSEINCVENIISFEGELSKENLALVNNLLDTNF